MYVVALSHRVDSASGSLRHCPLSMAAIDELLSVRPELWVDGRRPTPSELAGRLEAMWLPDEVVLDTGLAGTSLRRRVGDYYATPLRDCRRAGGKASRSAPVAPQRQFMSGSPCEFRPSEPHVLDLLA